MVPLSSSPASVFKNDDVVVLLGAGASVDAGIPHSENMVRQIEGHVQNTHGWKDFKDLYHYVRSAIYFADGIQGTFDSAVNYNIERLVGSLDELWRRDQHPIYPFIGAWNPRLLQVAGIGFAHIQTFRDKIVEILRKEWISVADYRKAQYFEGLLRFQKELNHTLRIFTLNYDMCVEETYRREHHKLPERGFDDDRNWRWQQFEQQEESPTPILLYKMHGSIDWQYSKNGSVLTFSDSPSSIKSDEMALIFGTSYKLQYVDPFLYLVYEFRRWTLQAKLLVLVGYGFGDDHVNGILGQAMRADPGKRIVAVGPLPTRQGAGPDELEKAKKDRCELIVAKLLIEHKDVDRIKVIDRKACDFLTADLTLSEMEKLFPNEASPYTEFAVDEAALKKG